eukprot:NODE_42_length_34079_cov_0.552619.p8 type:complete len:225 gc:universal NODE_42_length_34079_cov_0.552619:31733-32407(+)
MIITFRYKRHGVSRRNWDAEMEDRIFEWQVSTIGTLPFKLDKYAEHLQYADDDDCQHLRWQSDGFVNSNLTAQDDPIAKRISWFILPASLCNMHALADERQSPIIGFVIPYRALLGQANSSSANLLTALEFLCNSLFTKIDQSFFGKKTPDLQCTFKSAPSISLTYNALSNWLLLSPTSKITCRIRRCAGSSTESEPTPSNTQPCRFLTKSHSAYFPLSDFLYS